MFYKEVGFCCTHTKAIWYCSPIISIQVQKRNWPQKSERRVNFSLKIRYRLSLQNAGGNFTSDGALISFPMDIQSFMNRILAVVNCDQCGLLLSRLSESGFSACILGLIYDSSPPLRAAWKIPPDKAAKQLIPATRAQPEASGPIRLTSNEGSGYRQAVS